MKKCEGKRCRISYGFVQPALWNGCPAPGQLIRAELDPEYFRWFSVIALLFQPCFEDLEGFLQQAAD